ncbi:MAG: bifunctional glutamate N-acetyltransferase/amino-acid acetyltransferase ArgJ [Candidatus Electronema sp. V4]|uniref:bifunctional glutamate N-acetyltransferase/amino-acid acetyltransferase ArgJ n=1 Tax=Candidatus Electronema sp. V4 TaxID=3454756 RepID=UPI004055507A
MKVKGFSAAAVEAGIRYQNRLDLGLIFSEIPAVAAGVFTAATVKAAPVLLGMERLRQGKVQAIVVNSGNANACTGEEGMRMARAVGALAAQALKIDEELVQVASTGVIGAQLDLSPFAAAMPKLAASLSEDGFDELARAIMTTDTVPKTAAAEIMIDGVPVRLFAAAKGSGMIMPNMATMLCFAVTDANIAQPALQQAVSSGADLSFNRITVDGDTSTNDTVLCLANGAAGNALLDESRPEQFAVFTKALHGIFKDLAKQIVRDGEGATKLVTIRVEGAATQEDAVNAARTIANSPLVKTAFFGEDANWGRIIAALGRSGAKFEPERVAIAFDDALLVENGFGLGKEAEATATQVLKNKEFSVTVSLGAGAAAAEMLTCDLSCDYVKINANYRS